MGIYSQKVFVIFQTLLLSIKLSEYILIHKYNEINGNRILGLFPTLTYPDFTHRRHMNPTSMGLVTPSDLFRHVKSSRITTT